MCNFYFQGVNSMLFLKLGNQYTNTKCCQKMTIQQRRFKSHFGITPYVCQIVWASIIRRAPNGYQPKHLLWGLQFLKQYTDEHNRHSLLKADEKTIREWSWTTVKLLSDLDVVSDIYSQMVWSRCLLHKLKLFLRLFGKIEKKMRCQEPQHSYLWTVLIAKSKSRDPLVQCGIATNSTDRAYDMKLV